MIEKKTTYWLSVDGNTEVTREDDGILIATQEELTLSGLEIFISPSLFPAIREAMDKAERCNAAPSETEST